MTDSETELPPPAIQDGVPKARHPPVIEMVRSAIAATEDRKGATVPSIKKWISVNYPEIDQTRLKNWLRINLKKGLDSREFVRPKNSESVASVMLGRYKLGKDPKKAKTAEKLALKKKMKKKALASKKGEEDDEDEAPTTPSKRARPKKKVINRSHSFSPKVRTSKSKQLRRSLSLTPAKVVLKKVKTQKATSKKSPAKKSTQKSKAKDSPKKVSKKKSEKTTKTGKKAKETVKKDKTTKKTKKEEKTKSKPSKKDAANAKA